MRDIASPFDGFASPFGPQRGFNPASLFGSTEGLWFNFADQSSLYQDNLAATPLTAPDQSIGLAADRSRVRSPITTAAAAQASAGLRPLWKVVGSYGAARFDRSDDIMSETMPAAQTGDVLVFGRSGSWIESGVTYGSGSTWSIGVTTVTGLPPGLLAAIGDVVGIIAIGRTLTAAERTQALNYHKARGASGWLVAGAEMLTNGNFATDLTGWTNENITRGTSTWVAGQAFLNNTGTGNTVLWQSVTTVIGQPYLVSWDAAAITVPATARCFAGTSSTNGSNLSIISPTPPSSNRAIFVATATTTFISVVAFGATGNATFDNVSLKPLVAA